MNRYKLRPFVESDIDGLRQLWRQTWTDTYGQLLGSDLAKLLAAIGDEKLEMMLPGKDENVLVAVADAKIVGSVIYARRSLGVIWGMYVSPKHQRSGVGSALLKAAFEGLVGINVAMLVVMKSSAPAMAFYGKHGFKPGEDTGYEMVEGRVLPAQFMYARPFDFA